jgi:hypothetical protein
VDCGSIGSGLSRAVDIVGCGGMEVSICTLTRGAGGGICWNADA